MKALQVCRWLFALGIILAFSAYLHAESPFVREWTQLQQQRDKALEAADAPIRRSYRQGVETLLRRATQANDLEAVGVLRKELETLGGPEPLGGATETTATASAADEFAKRLIGTKWVYFGKETLTLLADGKAEWSTGKQIWPWKVSSVGRRMIEGENMAKGAKFTITFDHDLKTGTIEGEGPVRKTHLVEGP